MPERRQVLDRHLHAAGVVNARAERDAPCPAVEQNEGQTFPPVLLHELVADENARNEETVHPSLGEQTVIRLPSTDEVGRVRDQHHVAGRRRRPLGGHE
ncbi:MAG: hypothetical protein OXG37_06800 [Actinomycetia bacterium]|nr:hypothetical protein [Actinomycetes bacterium]